MKCHTMRSCAVVAAALLLATLPVRAVVTNDVDIAALIAAVGAGISETNGWTLSGLGMYAAGTAGANSPACVKFDTLGDSLSSPDFGATIIGLDIGVRCSATNNATRLLHVRSMDDAEKGVVATCDKGDKYEIKSLLLGDSADFSQFKIVLEGTLKTGNWGIGLLKVITANPIAAPAALAVVKTNMTSCVLEWVNDGNVVSNRVDAYIVESGIGDDVVFKTGFDDFRGNSTTPKDFTGDIPELLGDSFSGVRVYGAAGTNGICQLGTGKDIGILRYAGLSSYEGVNLAMTAKRHVGDNADTIVAYEWVGTTNAIATLSLTDEYAEYIVDLSKDSHGNDVPGGAAILLGYYTTKSSRRVLIDSLSIVRTGADVSTLIDSRWIQASQGVASFSTKGALALPPKANCRFVVFSQNADGCISEGATVETRLGEVTGFGFILR